VNDAVKELLLEHDEIADLDPASRRLEIRSLLTDDRYASLSVADVVDRIEGAGPLNDLMRDPDVTDILVNGPDEIWTERRGSLERESLSFAGTESLLALVQRWLGEGGTRADMSHPIADARLRDGSRVHVVLPPISVTPIVSIRRLPARAPGLDELVERGSLTTEQARELASAVSERKSIAISGATGTGKTTLLGSLLSLVPATERVVVLEETRELPCSDPHIVSLLTREANAERAGAVTLEQLVRASLRMRPDRIVVGEVRGPEALALLGALNTGHRGSLVTVHASSSTRVVDRIVALALQARTSLGEGTIRREAESAWDLFVHLERVEGRRRIVEFRSAP
jgi:pilus assembly protein CpaF